LTNFDLPVVILAGGKGTRLQEETISIPKPLVTVGGLPIIVHIMNIFLYQGFQNFIILTGYKSDLFEKFFSGVESWSGEEKKRHGLHTGEGANIDFKVTLVETGLESPTGERVRRLVNYLDSDFLLTYGDGLANVNVDSLIEMNKKCKTLITLTAVRPPARFGALEVNPENIVTTFAEKLMNSETLINGGFMYVKKEFLQQIHPDSSLESDILPELVSQNQLSALIHLGFWKAMDTLRDKESLNEIAQNRKFPWLDFG